MTPQFVRYAISGLLFAIAIVSRSQAAEAFQCEDEPPMPAFLVPLVDAPLNSHIWVTGGPASDFKLCSADKNCIGVKVRHSKYSSRYELIPKGLLAPKTQYTVSALVKTQTLNVGTFLTGHELDKTAPKGKALTRVLAVDYGVQSDAGVRQGYRIEMKGTSRDDEGDVLLGVWAAKKKPNYDRAPDAYLLRDHEGNFAINTGAICNTTIFPFFNDIGQAKSDDTPRFVIGVRAIDRAGNLGPSTQKTIDFRHAVIESVDDGVACELGEEIETTPRTLPDRRAPLDTHVWVFLRTVLSSASSSSSKFVLVEGEESKRIAAKLTGNDVVARLAPTSLLRPNTHYRVLDQGSEIGKFHTGSRAMAKAIKAAPRLGKPKVLRTGRALREIKIKVRGKTAPLYELSIFADRKLVVTTTMEVTDGVLRIKNEKCVRSDFSLPRLQRADKLVFRVRGINYSGRAGPWSSTTLRARAYR